MSISGAIGVATIAVVTACCTPASSQGMESLVGSREAGWCEAVTPKRTKGLTPEPEGADDLPTRFATLLRAWKDRPRNTSSRVSAIIAHPSYRAIVALGPPAVPYILAEIAKEPSWLFDALSEITQEDPVPREVWGNVPRMSWAWVEWGRSKGLI